MNWISLINGTMVGIFGMLLSVAFCDIYWTKRKYLLVAGSMAGLLLMQGLVYYLVDYNTVKLLYPVLTHIPLAIVLYGLSRKKFWSVILVAIAYLCCQLRRWLALFVAALDTSEVISPEIAEIVITLPLLLGLIRWIAPSMRSFSHSTGRVQLQFGLIPLLCYGFDYLTQIYTDIFVKGTPVVSEFMSFLCSLAYVVFVLHTSEEEKERSRLEQTRESLNLQVIQAVREIELLRDSQRQASTYRHDLRHHMQYLLTCLESEHQEKAKAYIRGICSEIESGRIIVYCENEAANLILSAFAERAGVQGIAFHVAAKIPSIISVAESDLCVFLSNAIENALYACQKLNEKGMPGTIDISAYEKNGKLFFEIANSCDSDVVLENGIPVTARPGHGIGVRSICALVDRYRGVYSFQVKNGVFILRVSF